MTKATDKFNRYFGTDFTDDEVIEIKIHAAMIAEDDGYDTENTNEHYYTAIEIFEMAKEKANAFLESSDK